MLCYNVSMEARHWDIYTLSDPRTEQVRYVGVTFRGKRRFNEHLSRSVMGGKTHRDAWIRSLIALGLRPVYQVIERGQGQGWQDAERRWIAAYRQSSDLANHTDGGDGAPGYVPTAEWRAMRSAARKGIPYPPGRVSAMKGRRHTAEARAKISRAGTRRTQSESARQKIADARKGHPLSTEQREKLSVSHKGKILPPEHRQKIAASTKNRKSVLCVETGESFPSITAVARALNVNEASVNQAIRKGCRCKGQHYRFL